MSFGQSIIECVHHCSLCYESLELLIDSETEAPTEIAMKR